MTAPDLSELLSSVSTTTVHVRWLALDAVAPEAWDDLASLIDEAERERAARFYFDRDRRAFIAAHALARTMLSAASPQPPANWRFVINEHGRPEIIRRPGVPPLRFNLSHTHGLVAVAMTLEHDVGIDVEAIDAKRLSLELAERFFAPAEVALLRTASADALPDQLFAIWTLKEACIKAMGRGLSVPLDSFALTLDPLAVAFADTLGENPGRWLLWRLAPTPAHTLALALRHPEPASVGIDAAAIEASDLLSLAGQLSAGAGQIVRR